MVQTDYVGHEALRQRILNRLPGYGNDDDEADALAVEWAEFLEATTAANTVGPHPYVPGFFCWVMHERFGAETGATPDGRKACFPLADGAGAAQGREKAGPTAVRNEAGLEAMVTLFKTFFAQGGYAVQCNVFDVDMLRDAQRNSERYASLQIRVTGWSVYFTTLSKVEQDRFIARISHNM